MASTSTSSQRAPAGASPRESSSSEASRGGIRIVPYSPPKPIEDDDDDFRAPIKTPTRSRYSTASHGPYDSSASPESAPSSAASSANYSLARPPARGVSDGRRGSVSGAAATTTSLLAPAPRRASHSSSRSPSLSPSPSYSSLDHQPLSPSGQMLGRSRRSNVIEVNPDKTFSVVLRSTKSAARPSNETAITTSSTTSAPLTASSLVSSHGQLSSDASHHDIPPPSPLSSVPESESPQVSPRTSVAEPSAREPDTSSPWNYRMTGGVRKVPQTPEPSSRRAGTSGNQQDVESSMARESTATSTDNQNLMAKASFSSHDTESSLDDNSNLRVIGQSSPIVPYSDSAVPSPAPSDANVQILGFSSPAYPSSPSRGADVLDTPGSRNFIVHNTNTPGSGLFTPARGSSVLDTPGSKNFIVHGKGTPASQMYTPYAESSSLETPGSRNFVTHGPVSRQSSVGTFPRHQPSVDSMAGFVREEYSQESLKVSPLNTNGRRKSSQDYTRFIPREAVRPRAASYSSISSIISQDNTALALAQQNLNTIDQEPSSAITWKGPFGTIQYPKRVDAQPHNWSSQLSTVMSEDERSDGSRIASQFSERSGSQHSRNMLSASSMSLSADEARSLGTQSRLDLERPSPTYLPSPVIRMIRDHDEDGDGLADLEYSQQLRHKASWSRVGSYISRRSSDRDLHSSASSRANSFSGGAIPAWARVYYGSGERKWLAAPSIRSQPSMQSFVDSRRGSFAGSGSPEYEDDIYNPRRRVRDAQRRGSRSDSMQINEVPQYARGVYRPKKKSSSIWSPHLKVDRRSTLYNAWAPPSVAWSAESGALGRRNIQIILFVVGFVLPFAWMIGAFLPLPVAVHLKSANPDDSQTELGAPVQEKIRDDQHFAFDDAQYQSARWWRNLNRVMSIVGILVLGAVAALVVIGVKDRWAQ
ncbi:uncharacterized protein B0I36DRAFT_73975 [Microdochium trichocladiopsis]|uniref:Serine-rich protein n=1 Tax=Microdochium trichocladiopsis TaxID=1682393 RepID=A0A9P9BV08_9PEZI|nr:uncharacterized protein B0I36DRAFT_73975 [Microdochium trichocladiopsis]KAH7038009.1 hypothetical protein B0I36DRAFT_73975 [Microdochium trichocladiopsis]